MRADWDDNTEGVVSTLPDGHMQHTNLAIPLVGVESSYVLRNRIAATRPGKSASTHATLYIRWLNPCV